MENHRTLKLARELDRTAHSLAFLIGYQPETRDNRAVFGFLRSVEDVHEDLLRAVVADMRSNGASWTDVGYAMGVSRQAAWERFSDPDDTRPWLPAETDAT